MAILALLSGCGGGGSGETSATEQAPQGKVASPAEGGKEASDSKGSKEQQGAGAKEPSSAQNPAKHGKPITLPKGEREPQATPAEEANATVVDIGLESPDVAQGGALPAAFTCDGKGSWPTLQWRGVPAGTAELVLFAMNLQPVEGKLFFDWALAGLDPGLEELESGKLPKGAVQGQNSFGKAAYEICPPQGQGETYAFALYALPRALRPKQGFDPVALRQRVQAISRSAGLLTASYGR